LVNLWGSTVTFGLRGITGTLILLLIRDGNANSWEGLCNAFDLDAERLHTGHSILLHKLEELREAGLIEFEWERKPGSRVPLIEGIQVTNSWEQIQIALEISLTKVVKLGAQHAVVVSPFFSPPDEVAEKPELFVLMPFAEDLRPIYDDHIRRVASELKLTVARADDFFSAHSVIADVWKGIFFAQVVIADCSGRNPNVFYEIGLAHVLGKPVVLITQNPDDVPFDLRYLRFIQYTFTPRGMVYFERALRETIGSILSI
jgi:hypothetical protein